MKEFSLRIPVAKWLLSRGMSPICEVGTLRNCDMLGVEYTLSPFKLLRAVAVELKLADVAGVIAQCRNHLPCVNEVWAAMPPIGEKSERKMVDAGIGLLRVVGDEATIVHWPAPLPAPDLARLKNVARSRRDEHKWRMKHPLMYFFTEHNPKQKPAAPSIEDQQKTVAWLSSIGGAK